MASVAAVVRSSKQVYDSPEELRLVHKAKRGDENAFRALYDAHHKRVFVTVKRMLSDEDTSQWIANIAFTQIWKGLPKFKEQSKFSTWVTRIAIREALMHLRTEKRHTNDVSLDAEIADANQASGQRSHIVDKVDYRTQEWLSTRDLNLAGIIDRQLLEKAIKKVPTQFHEILRLRFWEGLSEKEIQAQISIGEPKLVSIAAVKSRILRGKRILIKQVKKSS